MIAKIRVADGSTFGACVSLEEHIRSCPLYILKTLLANHEKDSHEYEIILKELENNIKKQLG